MAKQQSYGHVIAVAVAAGSLAALAVDLLKKRKSTQLKKKLRNRSGQDGLLLGGIALGVIQINVDSIKHPYLNLLGNLILLMNKD